MHRQIGPSNKPSKESIKELETAGIRRLGCPTVPCLRFGEFVSQPGAITIGAVECAVEASIFALQSLDFGNDVSFYLHHFSSHCVSGIVGDFELAT
jgi:hypothetical protein